MSKKYCPHCGAGTDYSLTPPKFCSQCAQGFDSAIASQSPAPVRVVTVASAPAAPRPLLVPYRDDDGEEDDAPREVANLRIPKKAAVSYELDSSSKVSLGSVMQGSADSVTIEKGGKKLSKKARREKVSEFRSNLLTTPRHDLGGE